MERYANKSGKSGAVAYEVGAEWIAVVFRDGERYRYTYASAGRGNVERMKRLARAGEGPTTLISREVRVRYAEKEGCEID
jgi:hypothetical protein